MTKDTEKSGKVVFRDYPQHQILLLPPSLEELISPKHLVRVVNEVIERIDLKILEKGYKGGGASNYHPRMMLKVLVYAYSTNQYFEHHPWMIVTGSSSFITLLRS